MQKWQTCEMCTRRFVCFLKWFCASDNNCCPSLTFTTCHSVLKHRLDMLLECLAGIGWCSVTFLGFHYLLQVHSLNHEIRLWPAVHILSAISPQTVFVIKVVNIFEGEQLRFVSYIVIFCRAILVLNTVGWFMVHGNFAFLWVGLRIRTWSILKVFI